MVIADSQTQFARSADVPADIKRYIVSTFSTPIVNYRWPQGDELNAALAERILVAEKSGSGISKSNVGGWHSELDFLEWPDDCIRSLRSRIEAFIAALNAAVFNDDAPRRPDEFVMEGWANVLRGGGYNSLHSHPNAFWSGVYYVTGNPASPDSAFSGKLELVDPRPGASLSFVEHTRLYGRFLVNPAAGQMIVFPSWLQHWVHPCQGDGARISIAYNVMIE